jgi:arylsulfatase A-like enzyme
VVETGPQSPLLTKRAVEFIRSHKQDAATADKPFFLFVGYVDTHSPHKDAPVELVEPYQAATFRDIPDEKFPECHGKALNPVAAKPGVERERRAQYYGAVSSIDREVGKVLAELQATGQLDNTVIVYTGDHGLNGGHHGVWEKGNATTPQNFLEESILIGCTVSWPAGGIRQGAVCEDMVNHCDTWATLLDLAGAAPADALARTINSPGRSYLPQLRGQNANDWRTAQISEYGNARMIRTSQHKLILRYPYAGVVFPSELYDLQADPRETVNRYDDAALAAVQKELTGRLNEFFEQYSLPEHSGLNLQNQPECTPASPWLRKA